MHSSISALIGHVLFFALLVSATAEPQLAQGGGVAVTTPAPTQMATVQYVGSLFTENGVTNATWGMHTQTFATTALGNWPIGATPLSGVIGLGSIQGTIGTVSERDLPASETPGPAV